MERALNISRRKTNFQQCKNSMTRSQHNRSYLKAGICVFCALALFVVIQLSLVELSKQPFRSKDTIPEIGQGVTSKTEHAISNNRTISKVLELESSKLPLLLKQKFVKFNPHGDSWCPRAQCFNSPMCRPCDRRFLFELATFRSGSTSIQQMLAMLPGVRMAGENRDMLRSLYEMIPQLRRKEDQWAFAERDGTWAHGYISRHDLACPAQRIIEALNPPRQAAQMDPAGLKYNKFTIFGFKTVRFLDAWGEKYYDAVDFVKQHFPCVRIVININSNVTKQWRSKFWRFKARKMNYTIRDLHLLNGRMVEVANLFGPEQAYVLDSNEWTKEGGVAAVNELVSWLGFEDCVFSSVLHDNWDERTGLAVDNRTNVDLRFGCRYIGDMSMDEES